MSKGKIIALIWSLSLLVGGAAVLYARWSFATHVVPSTTYRGIGIDYTPGTLKPWPGLLHAIDAIVETTPAVYPDDATELLEHLWIEVVPYDGWCKSKTAPDGKAPRVIDGAVQRVRLNGTVRTESSPFGPTYLVLVVRQLRDNDTWIESANATGTSSISSVAHSALLHEFGSHVAALRLFGDNNGGHTNKELAEFSNVLAHAYGNGDGVRE